MVRRKVRLTKAEIDRLNEATNGRYSFTISYKIDTTTQCYHCGGCGWLGVPDEVCEKCGGDGLREDADPIKGTEQDEDIDGGIF